MTDLSLGIHQSKNCCVTHGWFVCAVHQLSSTWIILELSVCRASVPVPGNVLVGCLGLCHFPAGRGRVECALGHCLWAKNHLGTWGFTLSRGILASSEICLWSPVSGWVCPLQSLLDLAGINENPTSALISFPGFVFSNKITHSAFDELRSFTGI